MSPDWSLPGFSGARELEEDGRVAREFAGSVMDRATPVMAVWASVRVGSGVGSGMWNHGSLACGAASLSSIAMLRLDQLYKSFGSVAAVDGLSLDIARGEVFGLLGPNGAGKSTTIGMCVGLVAPDRGAVTLEGVGPPSIAAARAHLGIAPQELAIYEDLTGEENLLFWGRLYGLRGAELKSRVSDVLGTVGLTQRARERVQGYSGGMKRRMNLAAALVHDPPMLLLDEPTAGVDPQSRNNILDLVKGLAGAGKTIVYTTHYMEEAAKVCDRIGIVDHGKLLALGRPDELVRTHGGRSVVHVEYGEGEQTMRQEKIETSDPVREIARVMDGVQRGEGAVRGIRIERPDLESVFLKLTGRSLRD
jgi:ABC-2 type transport system ATP-binding protein